MNTRRCTAALGLTSLLLIALISASSSSLFAAKSAASKNEFPDDYFFYPASDPHQAKLNELVGKAPPALQVADWMNGQVSASDVKGKVVVIDIWATWCGPCRAAVPHTNALYKNNKDAGLVVIGVCSSSRGQEKMEEIAKDDGITYPIARDPGNKTASSFNLAFYPTYAVIDRNGILRAIGLQPTSVDKVVEKLLKEKATAN